MTKPPGSHRPFHAIGLLVGAIQRRGSIEGQRTDVDNFDRSID